MVSLILHPFLELEDKNDVVVLNKQAAKLLDWSITSLLT